MHCIFFLEYLNAMTTYLFKDIRGPLLPFVFPFFCSELFLVLCNIMIKLAYRDIVPGSWSITFVYVNISIGQFDHNIA